MLRKLNEEGKPPKYNKGEREREREVKVPRIVRKLELCKKALHTD